MDPLKNPFSPGAGSPPPELVGRDQILEDARILLGRVKAKLAEKSLLLTGLRGVGKTVLLNEIERMAKEDDYRTVAIEAMKTSRWVHWLFHICAVCFSNLIAWPGLETK